MSVSSDISLVMMAALRELPDRSLGVWSDLAPSKLQKALTDASQKIGISEKYLVCVACLVVWCVLAGHGGELFFRLLSTAYPCYASFKALEKGNEASVRRWLTYWVVLGAIGAAEFVVPRFLAQIVSLWLIKTFVVSWCILPLTPTGSDVIYQRLLAPFFPHLQERLATTYAARD